MDVKIGLIIPTRGDRPVFFENCLRLIKNQTLQPTIVCVMDFPPENNDIDITKRYRLGYSNLTGKGLDLIAFWEDDDFYAPNYLEYWANKWIEYRKPDMLGSNFTIYYHLKLKKHFTFNHETRSSMMNTFIKPDMEFPWGNDNDPYTDIHLWNLTRTAGFLGGQSTLHGIIHQPPVLTLGIKHGVGLCGGVGHSSDPRIVNGQLVNNRLDRYKHEDAGLLEKTVDKESFNFYNEYSQKLPELS